MSKTVSARLSSRGIVEHTAEGLPSPFVQATDAGHGDYLRQYFSASAEVRSLRTIPLSIPVQVGSPTPAGTGSVRRTAGGLCPRPVAERADPVGVPSEVQPDRVDRFPHGFGEFKSLDGEVAGLQELEDGFRRIELQAGGRQFQRSDVFRNFDRLGAVPAGALEDHQCMPAV